MVTWILFVFSQLLPLEFVAVTVNNPVEFTVMLGVFPIIAPSSSSQTKS